MMRMFLFLLSLLVSHISYAVGQFNATGIHIEIDPDPASIASNCTDDFKAVLNGQLLEWVSFGVANSLSYKPTFPQNQNFTNYIWKGQAGSGRMLQDVKYTATSEDSATSAASEPGG